MVRTVSTSLVTNITYILLSHQKVLISPLYAIEGKIIYFCTLLYGDIRSEESVWPKADWRAASLAEGRLARGLVDSRLMDFEFRDIQKPTDKVSFDVARLRVYRKSEVIVS